LLVVQVSELAWEGLELKVEAREHVLVQESVEVMEPEVSEGEARVLVVELV
jgi:hypothetical protein